MTDYEDYDDVDIVYEMLQNKVIEDVRKSKNLSENKEINPEDYKLDYLAFADNRARECTYKFFAEKSKNNDQVNTTDLVECYECLMQLIESEFEGTIDYDDDIEELSF